jgi:alkylation response protein AidB-like acyl-CoA dehydrogenase
MSDTQISVEEYRAKAKAWLAENAPRHRDRAESGELPDLAAVKALQQKLYDAGFAGITWPAKYGGQGLTDEHQLAFNEEAAGYDMPQVYGIGHGMGGPTIMELGSEELKQRYIKQMLEGQVIWCQLFSEPGAGSDVAGLRTRAERDGDEWVVNGQKVWTSGAQHSDYGLLIARTDPTVPKHNGITMFVLDMHTPGVTVRPLKQATGESPFNEVFFDNVRIPNENIVGELNAGWAAAVIMLRHERISIGTGARPPSRPLSYESILAVARKMGRTEDQDVRESLALLYSIDTSGNMLTTRMRQEVDAGQELRARGSIAKLAAATIGSKAIETADEVLGTDLIAWDGVDWPTTTFGIVQIRALGIAGGSNEIQRGIIGERVLGLAKDPQLDREIPFNELRAMLPTKPPTK